jgi:16S rRNA (cytosine1402-N4)-methyltransferase
MNWNSNERVHKSVLVNEVLVCLEEKVPLKKQKIIDATVGTAGHSLEIIKKGAELLGIEADPEMIKIAEERLAGQGEYKLVNGNFRDIDLIAKKEGFELVDGIIFDLGVANPQLTSSERGFSFGNPEAGLDMRLDKEKQGVTAADLLNGLREDQLKTLFSRVLYRSQTNYLAKRIIERRENQPFKLVGDFLAICRELRVKPTLNPATLPFLALRMAVNSELENLGEALPKAFSLLKKGGRLLVITFHSTEEKIVRSFKKVGDPIVPTEEEKKENPRSRSAELFVIEKYD